jgi:hypothetical protein
MPPRVRSAADETCGAVCLMPCSECFCAPDLRPCLLLVSGDHRVGLLLHLTRPDQWRHALALCMCPSARRRHREQAMNGCRRHREQAMNGCGAMRATALVAAADCCCMLLARQASGRGGQQQRVWSSRCSTCSGAVPWVMCDSRDATEKTELGPTSWRPPWRDWCAVPLHSWRRGSVLR